MIMAAHRASTQATCHEMPGDSIRTMTERLTRHGLTVRTTGYDDSRLLKVTGTGKAACDVMVADDCYFTCEYIARRSRKTSAADMARMLGAGCASPQQYVHPHRGVTPAGAVGREMKARVMAVTMNVFEDETIYSVFADIVITNPAKPGRGKIAGQRVAAQPRSDAWRQRRHVRRSGDQPAASVSAAASGPPPLAYDGGRQVHAPDLTTPSNMEHGTHVAPDHSRLWG